MKTAVSNKLYRNEYLSAGSPKEVQEADSTILLNIPQTHRNRTDDNNNNNRYVWSHPESEVFLKFKGEHDNNFRWKTATECLHVLFPLCNLFFYCLSQPRVTLPILPPSDQTKIGFIIGFVMETYIYRYIDIYRFIAMDRYIYI